VVKGPRLVAGERLRPTLDDYRRHAELCGPELIIETAASHLNERELAELQSYVRHLERTKRWHLGGWGERRVTPRPCESAVWIYRPMRKPTCGGMSTAANALRSVVHGARALGMGQRAKKQPGRVSLDAKRGVQETA